MRYHTHCYAARAALLPALLGGCVTGSSSRPPRPTPPPSAAVINDMGYRDIIEYGTQLAHIQGYDVEALEAVPIGQNLWRVRFALPPKGSGRLLEIEFDAASRKLVKSVELQQISREVTPGRELGTLTDAGVDEPSPEPDGGPPPPHVPGRGF